MDVATLRRNVIANNIANANTPNFKRSDVNFESQLKRALDSEKIDACRSASTSPTRRTSPSTSRWTGDRCGRAGCWIT